MAADTLVLLHAAFVLFVVTGGLVVWRWPALAWVHVPCVLWGALVELCGWVCPLTPLEQRLRERSGDTGYHGDFVAHYVLPVLYPDGLTRDVQVALGVGVALLNLGIYSRLIRRRRAGAPRRRRDTDAG